MGAANEVVAGLELLYFASEILIWLISDSQRCQRKCLRQKYICMSILVHRCNNIFRWTLALGLCGGAGIFVCCISTTIKFHAQIPTFVFALFPILSLVMVIMAGIIVPKAARVMELSQKYVDTLKVRILTGTRSKLRYNVRINRATQCVSMEYGYFGTFKKTSILLWYFVFLEKTVTVLVGLDYT